VAPTLSRRPAGSIFNARLFGAGRACATPRLRSVACCAAEKPPTAPGLRGGPRCRRPAARVQLRRRPYRGATWASDRHQVEPTRRAFRGACSTARVGDPGVRLRRHRLLRDDARPPSRSTAQGRPHDGADSRARRSTRSCWSAREPRRARASPSNPSRGASVMEADLTAASSRRRPDAGGSCAPGSTERASARPCRPHALFLAPGAGATDFRADATQRSSMRPPPRAGAVRTDRPAPAQCTAASSAPRRDFAGAELTYADSPTAD
jgi:hypothetical protein